MAFDRPSVPSEAFARPKMVFDHAGPYAVPPGLGFNKHIRRYVKAKTGVTPSIRKRGLEDPTGVPFRRAGLVKRSVALDDARDGTP